MKYLFVVAHCDDELLGAGATIHKLAKDNDVYVYVMCNTGFNREKDMLDKCRAIKEDIGVKEYFFSTYEALTLDGVPHIELVQFIERAIASVQPDVVITHYDKDLHTDHRMVSEACKVACRLPQRETIECTPIKQLLYMEVPSSTDWGNGFQPNVYIKVSAEDVEKKLKYLSLYDGVLRSDKHPRGANNIVSLARVRGSYCGNEFAEAFMEVFRIEE